LRPQALAALPAAALAAGVLLAGCGGGSGGPMSSSPPPPPAATNQVAATVDAGPAAISATSPAINTLYVSVKVCAPGSTTACQTIDHVAVDTGASGFRVVASVLGSGLSIAQLKPVTVGNNNAVVECVQYVLNYLWGSVKTADLYIGGEIARNVPIEVIGDPAYPASVIPSTCSNGSGQLMDTVADLGANGTLGLLNFLQDCGPGCASGVQDGSNYSSCTASAPMVCSPAAVPLGSQVSNPVAAFAADNNGVVIQLPSVAVSGATRSSGTLTFGIGTASNNALGSAIVYQLDPGSGTLYTDYTGAVLLASYLDTGSNGLYFPDAAIPACTDASYFYCPTSTLSRSATIQGLNGTSTSVAFQVYSFDALAAGVTAAPGLAGPAGTGNTGSFAWGLPFFYGRTVYVVLENATVGGVAGPAVAF
jgi:hypothetical protein